MCVCVLLRDYWAERAAGCVIFVLYFGQEQLLAESVSVDLKLAFLIAGAAGARLVCLEAKLELLLHILPILVRAALCRRFLVDSSTLLVLVDLVLVLVTTVAKLA